MQGEKDCHSSILEISGERMLKVAPHPDYPPEEGRFIRGNDYSPVAVVIILITDAEEIPLEIERLVVLWVFAIQLIIKLLP